MEVRTLLAAVEALETATLPRTQIIGASSDDSDRVDLLLERPGSEAKRARLVVDLSPNRATLYLAPPRPGAGKEEAFHRRLIGRWIDSIGPPPQPGLLRFSLREPGGTDPSEWLVLEWLGGRPNAVIVDCASGEVLAACMQDSTAHAGRRGVGARYRLPPPPRRPDYGDAAPEAVGALDSADDAQRARRIGKGFAGLPAYLAYEAAVRGCGDPVRTAASLREIAAAPFDPRPYRLRSPIGGLPIAFVSPIPLTSMSSHEEERAGSLFSLLRWAHETVLRHEQDAAARDALLRVLDREAKRLEKLRKKIDEEARDAERSATLRRMAECLLLNLSSIPRGSAQFACPDPMDPETILTIPLDPSLTAAANADALFKQAKRLERSAPLRRRRIGNLEGAIASLAALITDAREGRFDIAAAGAERLRRALGPFHRPGSLDGSTAAAPTRRHPTAGARDRDRRKSSKAETAFHPRRFKTSEGWTVLVGRTNRENDYVTHALAAPDDYWFHAQGSAGSHVILRREGRKDNPSARTIEEAASIAAFYSRARTSGKAPVLYTLKKYVRRPRKGAPGLAVVSQGKSILVAPRRPREIAAEAPEEDPAGD